MGEITIRQPQASCSLVQYHMATFCASASSATHAFPQPVSTKDSLSLATCCRCLCIRPSSASRQFLRGHERKCARRTACLRRRCVGRTIAVGTDSCAPIHEVYPCVPPVATHVDRCH